MDPYSSGEELLIKPRKPYTITKQRERWTEEEHNRFLEALKLYGRAWQRIEEHIGTKTAVQIRSHAQKFFTKLEKEAVLKGVPVGQALDIEIPPPRPKRKPSNPYPRKTSVGTPSSLVGAKDGKSSSTVTSSHQSKHVLDLEKEPLPEKPGSDETPEGAKEIQDEDDGSEVFNLLHKGPSISLSSAYKDSLPTLVAPGGSCTYREFVPIRKEVSNQDETNESYITTEYMGNSMAEKRDPKQSVASDMCNSPSQGIAALDEKLTQARRIDEPSQSENYCGLPRSEAMQNYPRHVPVHILDGSLRMDAKHAPTDMPYHESLYQQMGGDNGNPALYMDPASSATSDHNSNASRSSVHRSYPFHPFFTPMQNQEDYRSYLQVSSTFSSLIVSALLQNPAAHAAASFAATFWPCANMECPADSPAGMAGGFPSRHISSTPNMAAIAAATVAAATAWWAAHGLLPLCSPYQSGFSCAPASASATPMETNEAGAANVDRRKDNPTELQAEEVDPECSEGLQEQHSSESPILSSSDSEPEGSQGAKLHVELAITETKDDPVVTEHDSNKSKGRKQVDRSSCGSNTTSSSEVETDALEKNEENKEDAKELDVDESATDLSSRRTRSASILNDSWKEVSQGGRLAFQALFSREVLPQSFSPPHDLKNKDQNNSDKDNQKADGKHEDISKIDLNGKIQGSCCTNQGAENVAQQVEDSHEESLLSIGLGHAKLKSRRTGFKPYKRCSVEAKESRVACASGQDEEKCPKRIRLEGEATT